MKAVITGANRGIGLEFCRQLSKRGDDVIAACRTTSPELNELAKNAGAGVQIVEGVDIASSTGAAKILQVIGEGEIDLLINNAGIMSSVTLDNLDADSIREQFEINALAPLCVTRDLRESLADGAKVAIVTSRMGSIDDNDSGGSYGYRMSKAAANMAGRSLSVDLKGEGVAVALLHPGYVRTDMTGGNGLIDPPESVKGLIAIMDRLDLEHTGLFWHTNGEVLPW